MASRGRRSARERPCSAAATATPPPPIRSARARSASHVAGAGKRRLRPVVSKVALIQAAAAGEPTSTISSGRSTSGQRAYARSRPRRTIRPVAAAIGRDSSRRPSSVRRRRARGRAGAADAPGCSGWLKSTKLDWVWRAAIRNRPSSWHDSRELRGNGRSGAEVLVLCYHAVSASWPCVMSVTPERMKEQLRMLIDRGYRGATFSDAVSEAPGPRTLAVTFDDAFRSVYELAFPILSELGLPGTVFVPTAKIGTEEPMAWPGIDEWVGGPYEEELVGMTWDHLEELHSAGWEIGSHTCSHPVLTLIDASALEQELRRSRA